MGPMGPRGLGPIKQSCLKKPCVWKNIVFNIPGHCYGSSKNGPYGPQGPWAQPLFDCVAVPSGVFFREKQCPKKNSAYLLQKIRMFVYFCYFGQC